MCNRAPPAHLVPNPAEALRGGVAAGSGGGNKSTVENNLQNSVRAFEDRDRDGDERDG